MENKTPIAVIPRSDIPLDDTNGFTLNKRYAVTHRQGRGVIVKNDNGHDRFVCLDEDVSPHLQRDIPEIDKAQVSSGYFQVIYKGRELVSKHSGKPWKIVDEHQYDSCPGAAQLIEDKDGNSVALMIDTDDGSVCDANARLISAAPDLLLACETLVAFLEQYHHNDEEAMGKCNIANDAIRKAIGG